MLKASFSQGNVITMRPLLPEEDLQYAVKMA